MALEKYGFFQGTTEDPRSYGSADMASVFRTIASSGVTEGGYNLFVSAEGGNMNTHLDYGTALLQGYYYGLVNDGSGVKAFTHTTEASLNRIDRIIIRASLISRTIVAVKLIGTAGSDPVAPALTRDSETYEISLAQVYIHAGASVIVTEDITDERNDDSVCGAVAPASMRQTTIQALIDAAIDAETMVVYGYDQSGAITSGQKIIARNNIDAQQKITGSGMLKGDGSGGVTAGTAGVDYAIPVVEIAATLAAASWSGSVAPFTQTIAVAGMTSTKKGVCAGLPASVTDAQFEEALAALLRVSAQSTNSITIKAHGEKPVNDIPVLVMIKG
jgi:hypothetical protein